MSSGCSTTSVINTSVTVPQVAFHTGPKSSVGLVAGTPAPASASPTAGPGANSPVQGQGQAKGPGSPSASGSPVTTSAKPTGSTTPFTGAACKSEQSGILLSVVLLVGGLAVFA